MKVVAISGYFNPIHPGHLDYITEARKLGDYLVVIVNNDKQVKQKESVPFMHEKERVEVLKYIKGVDNVFLSIDEDKTVCESLREIKPDIFANGGDRYNDNVPEDDVCRELGIEMVFSVGGKKTQSSSTLIQKASTYTLIGKRPWGRYIILQDKPSYKLKEIFVKCGELLSLQSHEYRDEHWVITGGKGEVTINENKIQVKYGDTLTIKKEQKHRIENTGNELLTFIEVQTGNYFGEDDIKRYEDKYNRK